MVSISRCILITDDESGQQWVVNDHECIGGTDFIKIEKKNPSLGKFVTGKAHGLRTAGNWIAELKRKRTEALLEHASSANASSSLFVGECGRYDRRVKAWQRKRVLASRMSTGELPPTIVVDLPAFEHAGRIVPAQTMRLKSTNLTHECVMVELSAANIEYIKCALLEDAGKKECRSPLEWCESSQGWFVSIFSNGKRSRRLFKADAGSSDEAKQKAERFLSEIGVGQGECSATIAEEDDFFSARGGA